jgi:hypothetical protein
MQSRHQVKYSGWELAQEIEGLLITIASELKAGEANRVVMFSERLLPLAIRYRDQAEVEEGADDVRLEE